VVGDDSYGGSGDGFARYSSLVRGLKKKKSFQKLKTSPRHHQMTN